MADHLKDLTPHLLRPDQTVREAMERLSGGRLKYQFLLLADLDGRLMGTVSDGDIRRALLAGADLSAPATRCANQAPMTGSTDTPKENLERLYHIGSQTAYLPIVDRAGVLAEVLVRAGQGIAGCRALIMAGGFGRRLGDRTKDIPKPLLPVGGKPILQHILERLKAASVHEIYVSVHYLADRIERFVSEHGAGLSVELLHEPDPLGTAGAVSLLPPDGGKQIMVINGDVLTSLELESFIDFHQRQDFDATVAVAQHQVTIPFGVVRQGEDGGFLGIDEKPTMTNFVAAGLYLLSPEYHALIRPRENLDMPELLNRGQSIGLTSGLFPLHEYWTDVGSPEDLERARSRLTVAGQSRSSDAV